MSDAPRTTICAECGADWDCGPVPDAIIKHYHPGARWSRRIAIYDRDKDRTVSDACPECGDVVPCNG